jgi:hypothetical protein
LKELSACECEPTPTTATKEYRKTDKKTKHFWYLFSFFQVRLKTCSPEVGFSNNTIQATSQKIVEAVRREVDQKAHDVYNSDKIKKSLKKEKCWV